MCEAAAKLPKRFSMFFLKAPGVPTFAIFSTDGELMKHGEERTTEKYQAYLTQISRREDRQYCDRGEAQARDSVGWLSTQSQTCQRVCRNKGIRYLLRQRLPASQNQKLSPSALN